MRGGGQSAYWYVETITSEPDGVVCAGTPLLAFSGCENRSPLAAHVNTASFAELSYNLFPLNPLPLPSRHREISCQPFYLINLQSAITHPLTNQSLYDRTRLDSKSLRFSTTYTS
jgi:hypothetical protein